MSAFSEQAKTSCKGSNNQFQRGNAAAGDDRYSRDLLLFSAIGQAVDT